MRLKEYGKSLPPWFHRANWAGGALACLAIGLYPVLAWQMAIPTLAWALFWIVMGAGAARNAWRGINSIHVPARFRRKRPS
jgi:hypothetical protein